MGLLKTQQEMFVVCMGNTLKEKRVIPPEIVQTIWQGCPSTLGKDAFKVFAYSYQKVVCSRIEVTETERLDGDQHYDFHPQDSHPIGVEDLVLV